MMEEPFFVEFNLRVFFRKCSCLSSKVPIVYAASNDTGEQARFGSAAVPVRDEFGRLYRIRIHG